jgi:hypothetical protein
MVDTPHNERAPRTTHRVEAPLRPVWPALLAASLLMTGCNLSLDVDDYPYRGPGPVDAGPGDTGPVDAGRHDLGEPEMGPGDTGTIDAGTDMGPDLPEGPVELIFTEVMINTRGTDGSPSNEGGEYIEVKNIGTGYADPRDIVIEAGDGSFDIRVDTEDLQPFEDIVLADLEPILPGEYFLFIRRGGPPYNVTVDMGTGTFYQYAVWYQDAALSNSSRTLDLYHVDEQGNRQLQDSIAWLNNSFRGAGSLMDTSETLSIEEDIAISLQPDHEDAASNDDPAHWCYDTEPCNDMSELLGSPGRAATDCSREVPSLDAGP